MLRKEVEDWQEKMGADYESSSHLAGKSTQNQVRVLKNNSYIGFDILRQL